MRIRSGLLAAMSLAASGAIAGAASAQPTTQPGPTISNFAPPPLPPPMPSLPDVNLPSSTPATQPAPIEPSPPPPTNTAATSQTASTAPFVPPGELGRVVVTSDLDLARDQISPSLGATAYSIGPSQIQETPQGVNAPFQQVLLRAPGVVMDSFGQEHVRGEHGNLTYELDGVILPDALNGFGQELDTRIAQSVTLIDGTLPAQYGFRTAAIVDVTTKTGQSLNGNEVSIYGGTNSTFEPSFLLGGTEGKWDYFVSGSYKNDDEGIENPTPSRVPIHDETSQSKLFTYLSYHIDDTSRITLMTSASYSNFQIPNTPDLPQLFTLAGTPFANSANTDENQNEQDYYGILAYQKTLDNFSLQASAFTSYGAINFTPDAINDLIFQGVAAGVLNTYVTNGVQLDSSYVIDSQHTLRTGLEANYTLERLDTDNYVFPTDPTTGLQSSDQPLDITDDTKNHATMAGVYLQDEWHLTPALTLNYGLRYDTFNANFDNEDQLSPRANLVWKVDKETTAHVGYARYFVPPPVQDIPPSTIAKFANTTNAPASPADDPPKVERSDYFDTGISHQFTPAWQVNVDGFYKMAHNLVDEGQFGDAVILSPYNYAKGTVYGAEISSTYKLGAVSLFGNFAWVQTLAHDIDSQQFSFPADELTYIQQHNIELDHQSTYTASLGASYEITKNDRVSVDALYGSGLRAGFANLETEPQYFPVNLGYEHDFHPNGARGDVVKLRFDIINVFDEVYQIRSGTGLGVNAPQYGQRRTFLAGLAYDF